MGQGLHQTILSKGQVFLVRAFDLPKLLVVPDFQFEEQSKASKQYGRRPKASCLLAGSPREERRHVAPASNRFNIFGAEC